MADQEIASLRAAAHPLRLRMLSLLTGTAMSAAEVARELDITHANASYHLRLLHDADLLVVEGEERIRGGVAKRYRHPFDRPESKWTDEDVAAQVEAMCSELLRRFPDRVRGKGTFTDAELWVTPEVWERSVELLVEASMLVHREARRPHTKGTVPINLTVAGFRMGAGELVP